MTWDSDEFGYLSGFLTLDRTAALVDERPWSFTFVALGVVTEGWVSSISAAGEQRVVTLFFLGEVKCQHDVQRVQEPP